MTTPEERNQRRLEAAIELDKHEQREDGSRVVSTLFDGLAVLGDLFFTRVHADVERTFGMDSMLLPVSAMKAEMQTRLEIDLYQVAESAVEVRERGYIRADEDWYGNWLAQVRLGEAAANPASVQRLTDYIAKSPDDRRLAFSKWLERTLPEARRAPLIIYRLLPLAVSVVTALAFQDQARATDARRGQVAILPGIADCHQCRGNLLEIGEKCPECGNPFWKFDWLTAE